MQANKWRNTLDIIGVIVFSSLPQFIIYPKGYFYESDLPPTIKYPLNVICFVVVYILGYRYLIHNKSLFVYYLWIIFYALSAVIIFAFYAYKYYTGDFNVMFYSKVMRLFTIACSPIPFIIAALLIYVNRSFKKLDLQQKRSETIKKEK